MTFRVGDPVYVNLGGKWLPGVVLAFVELPYGWLYEVVIRRGVRNIRSVWCRIEGESMRRTGGDFA